MYSVYVELTRGGIQLLDVHVVDILFGDIRTSLQYISLQNPIIYQLKQ